MDAIDILGSILGRRKQSKTSGGGILRDILGGRRKQQPQHTGRTETRSGSSNSGYGSGGSASGSRYGSEPDAESLEDLLDVAANRHRRNYESRSGHNQTPPVSRADERERHESHDHRSRGYNRNDFDPADYERMTEQSKILIRAMVNASKCDGRIDRNEQESILEELDQLSREEDQFLRNEFAAKLDVREFCWSVPIGMEQQVYMVSLMAIDLDNRKEQQYLTELAHGLRIPPTVVNQIHRRYGAPEIFRT